MKESVSEIIKSFDEFQFNNGNLYGSFENDIHTKIKVFLKRDIPCGEPTKSWVDSRGYTDTFVCNNCNAHIQVPYLQKLCDYSYCPYCGQRWDDYE